jgi:hypothetical protein
VRVRKEAHHGVEGRRDGPGRPSRPPRNLEGDLKDHYLRLRAKDKGILSYEALTGEVRFRKL